MQTMTITHARQGFLDLPEKVQEEPVFVTKHGRLVMALLSAEQYEGMLETMEILGDQAFVKRLQKSIEQAQRGQTVSLEEAAAQLGLA